MTEELFRKDAYLKSCEATVTSINALGGISLDRSVFYPTGGGQAGDRGVLRLASGDTVEIVTTVKGDGAENIVHVPAEDAPALSPGDAVTAEINWDTRYAHMRMHTCLHLLCAVVPYGVTGGQINATKSRLDFDIGDGSLDKGSITVAINKLIEEDHPVAALWISDAELDANPDLVRTMSVKPPSGAGSVRIIDIAGADLQPCGGTHVANTSEIGPLRVGKIENKGAHNRRINIHLED